MSRPKRRSKQVTQAYSQTPWRKQMQWIGLFLLVLVFGSLVAGLYLNVTARASEVGRHIQDMQDEVERLKQRIADLETHLAQLNSIDILEERAQEMGFHPYEPTEVKYIVIPNYTGRNYTTLAPPPQPVILPSSSLLPAYTQSLLDWLRQKFFLPSRMFFEERP